MSTYFGKIHEFLTIYRRFLNEKSFFSGLFYIFFVFDLLFLPKCAILKKKTTEDFFMNIKKSILSFFGKTCTSCVGLSLLFYLLIEILSTTSLDIVRALPAGQFLLLLLCAALLNAASYIFLLPLPKAINVLLHYIVCILSLFVTFIATGKVVASNAANVLVFFVIFSFLYALYWGLFLLARFLLFPEKRKEKTKKEQKKEAEYVNRF